MYTLLVVDDNGRDARIVQETVRFQRIGINVAGVATDGKEALTMIESLKPDIILSDICMPVMNGVEMAEVLAVTHPEIKVVFMSSYDDFNFAKSAIELMICGYVLKPVNPGEIEAALSKVVDQFEKEKRKQLEAERLSLQLEQSIPILRDEFFRELLSGTVHSEYEIRSRMKFLKTGAQDFKNTVIISMTAKNMKTDNTVITDLYMESISVMNVLQSLKDDFVIYSLRHSYTYYTLLLFFHDEDVSECMNMSLDFVMGVQELIAARLGISADFGISNASKDPRDIAKLFQQSKQAIDTKFYTNKNPAIFYSEIECPDNDVLFESFRLADLPKEIEESIFMGEKEDIDNFVDKYLPAEPSVGSESYLKSFTYFIVNILTIMLMQKGLSFQDIIGDETVLWRKLIAFESIVDLRQWLKNIIWSVKKNIEDNNNTRNISIVNTIKDVIRERYMESLNVSEIAKSVYLSPKQANSIFRKSTGYTIFDYLTEYRMEKAKQLLKSSGNKIFSIAENVGYTNKSHFALMFKRHTGMTPAEYKSKPVL